MYSCLYIDIMNYGCGSISHTFGILVSDCIYTHVNGKLEYIRLTFLCTLMYHMMVEDIPILRRSTANTHAYILPLNSTATQPPSRGITSVSTPDIHLLNSNYCNNFYAVSSLLILVWPPLVRIPESLPAKVVNCVVLCIVCV
jgi:hypothetical protein